MARQFVTAKIHRATVTGADLRSRGSISIPKEVMDAMGALPYELVHVNSLANGCHWETFIIPGLPGEITLHGPPAHLFRVGDRIELANAQEIPFLEHRCVEVDDLNRVMKVTITPVCKDCHG
jgi:aspartate 1-decarboxylase